MPNQTEVDNLNKRFAVPDSLGFEPGRGALVSAVVENPACTGSVCLHGAHVCDFQPAGHGPVLFMSSKSVFAEKKAIRGGVPICFPWFGPNADDPAAPSHGYARITPWEVISTERSGPDTQVVFATSINTFDVRYTVRFGEKLSMTLHTHNTSDEPAGFEAALHTYLTVADVADISITGLEKTAYLDKVDGGKKKTQDGSPIRFTGETDRVYIDSQSTCVLTDPGMNRRITVDKSGSESTVVWNPWIDKARALADLGDDDWRRMVCIETANAGPNRVTLEPGASHEMKATVRVDHL